LTLEQLVAELQKLEPETGVSPKVLIGIAAGVAVLGGGCVFYLEAAHTNGGGDEQIRQGRRFWWIRRSRRGNAAHVKV